MIFQDPEFGEVVVRKNALSKSIRFSLDPTGRLKISVPSSTNVTERFVKCLLKTNHNLIRTKIPLNSPSTQRARDMKQKILRKKAQEYLPYRLAFWAQKLGYRYDECKLKHAATRWGSCTHRNGELIIALNIGLMQVPEILRDYVIIHELAHINHPDHSAAFWAEVGAHDPRYKEHRKKLKAFSPGV